MLTGRRPLIAPWKVLLPVQQGAPVLTVGLGVRELESLGRTWDCVHCLQAEEGAVQEAAVLVPEARITGIEAAPREPSYAAAVLGPHCSPGLWPVEQLAQMVFAGGTAIWTTRRLRRPSLRALRDAGFGAVRTYALLPPRSAKIMLPLSDPRSTRTGLKLYTPGKRRNQLAVRLAGLATRAHCQFVLGRRMVISARKQGQDTQASYLLDWLGQQLNRPIADVTVYSGHIGRTLQLQGPDGQAVAVAKLSDTVEAEGALLREVGVLNTLAQNPRLHSRAPEVMACGRWGPHFVQVQSVMPLGRQTYCRVLTRAHMDFLKDLASMDRGPAVLGDWPQWAQLWQDALRAPSCSEADAAREAVRASHETLQGITLPFHRIHGDFAPWNVGLRGGQLVAVDWEYSEADGLAFYDLVHFAVRVARLLQGRPLSLPEVLARPVSVLHIEEQVEDLARCLTAAETAPLTSNQMEALVRLCLVKERLQASAP